ncbi:hypothetical protein ASF06_01730 [Agreia sp. Leaf244]|nr:hypothetical protein ASF06_01730 [Agreia sp. Leaf244]
MLHAYSATNAGDGLLVTESLGAIKEAFPAVSDVTIVALHPETFELIDSVVVDGSVGRRGVTREFIRTLHSLDSFDMIFAVGGGYLRAGHLVEGAKTLLAHGYQLWRASRTSTPVVYLPQSIGPLRFGSRFVARRLLRNVSLIFLRDDRSVDELALDNTVRIPDLALLSENRAPRSTDLPETVPVLTVRSVRGKLSPYVVDLSRRLGTFDGYVQSTGASNDDTEAMASLKPRTTLSRADLLSDTGPRRVVIAVRLHAALMALNAGHWVIHLAYERKGFGAFGDLNLSEYVFNVNDFDPAAVEKMSAELIANPDARSAYDAKLASTRSAIRSQRQYLVDRLRQTAGVSPERHQQVDGAEARD